MFIYLYYLLNFIMLNLFWFRQIKIFLIILLIF